MISKYKPGDKIKYKSIGEWGQTIIVRSTVKDVVLAEHIFVYLVVSDNGVYKYVKETEVIEYPVQGIDY
jgi:hypothetical protein